ncbi:DUF1206 domain-containing protein [Kribbella sp. CA-294648]|uniref:DUF1206 domain-containing protein n=1 Tax=Kribbella sp. CA-294648 TaxID=3239948 RepID=UPI003D903D0C
MTTAQQARQSPVYHASITVGLIAYGVVHLLIAWIAVQIAWGKKSEEGSHEGALHELASKPFGEVLLWIAAAGLLSLVIWKGFEVAYGFDTKKRLKAAGRALLYLVLAISAAKVAMGSSKSSAGTSSGLSAKLMQNGAGRVLVVLIGLLIVGFGIYQIHKAIKKKFLQDLVGGVSESTILLGRIGYAAKGIAFVIAGALFAWAAIDYDPKKAGGLDTALRTVRDQPFGSVLLTLLALGVAAFGIYAFVWSRNAKH